MMMKMKRMVKMIFLDVYFTQFRTNCVLQISITNTKTIHKLDIKVWRINAQATQQGTERDDNENWLHVSDIVIPM